GALGLLRTREVDDAERLIRQREPGGGPRRRVRRTPPPGRASLDRGLCGPAPRAGRRDRGLLPGLGPGRGPQARPQRAAGAVAGAAVLGAGSPPERLGDFRILGEIGRGGMGVVYEAEQESLIRRVALKVLATPTLVDPQKVHRFHREARAAANLHHTHIVP